MRMRRRPPVAAFVTDVTLCRNFRSRSRRRHENAAPQTLAFALPICLFSEDFARAVRAIHAALIGE
jgi:hypothetical protein